MPLVGGIGRLVEPPLKDTSPFSSTISRIPTTLKYLPLFPVSQGGAVEIMPNNFPMGVAVLGGSCPAIGVIALEGICPTGVMVLGGSGPGG